MTTPTGKVNFCCISFKTHIVDDNGHSISLSKDSFTSAWNTKYLKNIRKKMVSGEPVLGCETCYNQENFGKKSYRQTHNEEWLKRLGKLEFTSRVENSIKSDFHVEKFPVYLDLRLGNLCNLKCRMCNPHNSIMIEKEWREIDQNTNNEYSRFWQKQNLENGSIDKWYESENFWNDIEKHIPYLKKVYMTGGEPTLIEANYKFLDKCKELGYAHQIELFFNLNFTTMKDRFIEQLKYFKWTSINASLDGFNADNEYIRGNSNWQVTSNNIEKLIMNSDGNVGLGFSPVIQIYNILSITDLLDYVESLMLKYNKNMLVDFLYCFHPDFLDFAILPKSIKMEAKKRIVDWTLKSKTLSRNSENSHFLKNSINSLLTRLDQTLDEKNHEKVIDFIYYTKTLDEKRNQSFSKSFPKLNEMLNEAGY
jgi:organic radical activating enzyme